ncbi:MAG: tetratricopeptide repeat protein [Planctomycetota bacterium]|jgi:tetratricopeptide (TPR) repeat protein
MPDTKNMKRRQTERPPSTRRAIGGTATAKLVIGAALIAFLCAAIAAYIISGKQKDASITDSATQAHINIADQNEPNDTTAKPRSTPAPKPAVVDVNEQIDKIKQRKLQLAEELRDKFPDKSEPLILLGNVYRDLGDTSEAVRYWKRALEIGSARPDLYEGLGMVAMEKGQYEEAVDFWRKSLEYNPRDPGLRTSIAQALMRLGRSDEAMTELKRQIDRYPDSAAAHFLIGQILLQKKEYERAREKYLKVIELNPDHTNAHYGLLTVSARLGEKQKVKKYREKFNQLKTRDTQKLIDDNKLASDLEGTQKSYAETVFNAAQISEKYGQISEAKALLEEATKAAADDLEMLVRIAQWHHQRGRIQESLSIHERIAAKYPENGFNFFQLGMLYARVQRFDDAKKSLMSSIEFSPEFPDAYRELARLSLLMRKDIPQARVLAQKAVSLAPTAANFFVLSRACDANGDRQGALDALKEAMALEPANKEYKRIYDLLVKREP